MNRTRLILGSAIGLSALTLATLAVSGIEALRLLSTFIPRHERVLTQSGRILHLDEVLTMSARMAAATGDPAWEERYRRHEPDLDAAIAGIALEGAAAERIDAANRRLVELENRAFTRVREGRRDEASAVLLTKEYDREKAVYAEALHEAIGELERESAALLKKVVVRGVLGGLMAVLAVGFSVWAWLAATTMARRHHELSEALQQVRRLEGLLPICSYCKRIRDEANLWHKVEAYVAERSEARFTHGVCPTCLEKVLEPQLREMEGTR